jgi:hypothetical protein
MTTSNFIVCLGGEAVEISDEFVNQSETLTNMKDMCNDMETGIVYSIQCDSKYVEWIKSLIEFIYSDEYPKDREEMLNNRTPGRPRKLILTEWEKAFFANIGSSDNLDELFNLNQVANHLVMKNILNPLNFLIASYLEDKKPEDFERLFGIEPLFNTNVEDLDQDEKLLLEKINKNRHEINSFFEVKNEEKSDN